MRTIPKGFILPDFGGHPPAPVASDVPSTYAAPAAPTGPRKLALI